MWNSTRLKRALAIVLVVAMAGCHSIAPGGRAHLAATPSVSTVFGPAPPLDAGAGQGLAPVCMQMGGLGIGKGGVLLLGGFLLVMSPILIGGWLLSGLEGFVGLLQRR